MLRVNDRGPTQANRILDVSRAAAGRLGSVRAGVTEEVKVEVVEVPEPRSREHQFPGAEQGLDSPADD